MIFEFSVGSVNGDTHCVDIEIIDDSVLEEDETFTVTLERMVDTLTLLRGQTTITIIDNEGSKLKYYCNASSWQEIVANEQKLYP